MALKGEGNMFKASAVAFAFHMAGKGAEMIYNEFRRREREKTNKVLESMMNEAFQDFSNKIKALHEDFKTLEESTKHEVQIIGAELEKNKGNKEMEFVWALESMLNRNLQQLSQKIQTLVEDALEWPQTTMCELQQRRGNLEKNKGKEKEIARDLLSVLKKKLWQLSRRIQTLEKEVKECPEITKHELQLLRRYLAKNKEKKDEESSRALQCRMETLLQELSQRFQTLEQALQLRQAFPYHQFLLFRAYLENNQGFFRSVSGGEVEWITPGASDNLHANQDQRTACLDPLFRSIEGIQRSMDIRANRTNDLQVLMLTLVILISVIILARIFTLPWP